MNNYSKRDNPRNPASALFRRLTRLFSGPLVNYRRQTERNLRRKRISKYRFKDVGKQSFKRHEYNPFEFTQTELIANQSRAQRYVDFRSMEFSPDIGSCLDIYADEITTHNRLEPMLNIDCPNSEIKDILNVLYYNILGVEYNLFGWCRSMCKFGDLFLYLDIDEDNGIKYVIGLPPEEIQRIEGEDETNPNYYRFVWELGNATFENWQIAHFRILGNDKHAPYGTSVLDAARRIHRQLTLLEDAMMAYRIVRAPERRVFYMDVGNIPPQDIEQYMLQAKAQMKQNQVVDPTSGKVDYRYNPLSVEEDYFIPVRGSEGTKIDTLPGGTYTGDIDDVKYLRDKLFSALKVPMSYISRGEGADEDKSTLASKDIRFARTIQRIQRSVISELQKIGILHLYVLGYRGEDLLSFDLSLNNPSKIAELQELEHWRTKSDVASSLTEGYFSRRWIANKMFGLSDEEFLRNQREMYFDKQMDAKMNAIIEGGESSEGGLADDFGTADEFGDEDLEDTDLGAEEEIEEPEEDDDVLLAAPGKRDEGHLTPRSKGKIYIPVKSDKRRQGARKRNMKSQYSSEKAGTSNRNLFSGQSELSRLARGMAEQKESSYDKEDREFIKDFIEIEKMINEIENSVPKDGDKIIIKENKKNEVAIKKLRNRNNRNVKK